MSVKIGSQSIQNLYVGTNKIQRAYVGSQLVYQSKKPIIVGKDFESISVANRSPAPSFA